MSMTGNAAGPVEYDVAKSSLLLETFALEI